MPSYDDVRLLWDEHRDLPFPGGLAGEEGHATVTCADEADRVGGSVLRRRGLGDA